MKLVPSSLSILMCMALLGVAPAAQAQGQGAPESYQVRPDSSDTRSYEVSFTDDPLDALPTSSYIAQIRVRSKHVRALLIRPRTSFVTEMLVSVQAL